MQTSSISHQLRDRDFAKLLAPSLDGNAECLHLVAEGGKLADDAPISGTIPHERRP